MKTLRKLFFKARSLWVVSPTTDVAILQLAVDLQPVSPPVLDSSRRNLEIGRCFDEGRWPISQSFSYRITTVDTRLLDVKTNPGNAGLLGRVIDDSMIVKESYYLHFTG
jgi:hypothetical protein